MRWFHIYVESIHTADQLNGLLQDAIFAQLARGNNFAAAFCRFDPSGAGGTNFYLSPKAASHIAKEPAWKACDRPSRSEAGSLVAGDQACIEALFE